MSVARRSFLLSLGGLLISSRSGTAKRAHSQLAHRTEKCTLANLIGSLQNPYDKWWSKGGELCAAAFNSPYTFLQCEGDFGKKGMDLLLALIAKTNGNMVLNVSATPKKDDQLRTLAATCAEHRVYFVTQNNKPPAALRPWAMNQYYVAHIEFDHRLAGLRTGRQLITSIGKRGGILAFGASPNDTASLDRLAGLKAALSSAPNCYLLADPLYAEWQASTAYDMMRSQIAQQGQDRIQGVWAANDDMALGAIEALRLYGLAVPVTGIDGNRQAIDAVQNGTMAATVAWDLFWQGGIGLALALGAKTGLVDVQHEPHSHRAFYAPFHLVTADNAANFVEYRDAEHPFMNWGDYWGQATGAIPDV